MKKLKDNIIIETFLTTVFMGLICYAAYSLWYVFYGTESGGDIHLYTILSGVALGWFMLMFTKTVFKNANWVKKLIPFLAGIGLFQGLIWGINSAINKDGFRNEDVVIYTYTITFILSAIIVLSSTCFHNQKFIFFDYTFFFVLNQRFIALNQKILW